MSDLAVVILAAGKGTRMRSDLAKVLHSLAGKPLLSYALDTALTLEPSRLVVVVGHQADKVRQAFSGQAGLRFVKQQPQLGTGHALMAAAPELNGHQGPVLIVCGDVPGLKAATLQKLLQVHRQGDFALTVLGMELKDPGAYGRLIIQGPDRLAAIREFRDASPQERAVNLVNAGVYAAQAGPLLAHLPLLSRDNDQKEYYLTDLAQLMHQKGLGVGYALCDDPGEVEGINSMEELAAWEARLRAGN
jgi:UDP-N-acetylglucosamine diphosphorylase/glucosamine-1-phosphate N-acetyltransferase